MMNTHEISVLVSVLGGAVCAWYFTMMYYQAKLSLMQEIANKAFKENTALKMSLASGVGANEAKKLCAVILAALSVEFSKEGGIAIEGNSPEHESQLEIAAMQAREGQ